MRVLLAEDDPMIGEAIQAALNPPDGTWLYFITDLRTKPYKTHFTASSAQFQQWQKKFQS